MGVCMSDSEINVPSPGTAADAFASTALSQNDLLFHAAKKSDLWLLERALSGAPDVNCTNENEDTPLIVAARQGSVVVVEALLKAGADPLLTNKDGLTALAVSFGAVQELNRRQAAGESSNPSGDAKSAYDQGLVSGLLLQAEKIANDYAIASCANGVKDKLTVRGPLKFKPQAK